MLILVFFIVLIIVLILVLVMVLISVLWIFIESYIFYYTSPACNQANKKGQDILLACVRID